MTTPVRQSVIDRWAHLLISCLMACTVLTLYTALPLLRAIQPVCAATAGYCLQAVVYMSAAPSSTLYLAAGLGIVLVSGGSFGLVVRNS